MLAYVASVRAARPFLFATIALGEARVPRWIFVEEGGRPRTALDEVAPALEQHLRGAQSIPFDEVATSQLEKWLAELAGQEREILPPRKRRALDLLENTLHHYRKTGRNAGDYDRVRVVDDLLDRLANTHADLYYDPDQIAAAWLDILRPRLLAEIERRRHSRRRPFLLSDLGPELRTAPLSDADLATLRGRTPSGRPLRDRVVAAIVGVAAAPEEATKHATASDSSHG